MAELGFGRSRLVWAEVIDVSMSGMLCRTVPDLDPKATVSISMIVPGGTRVDFEGIAVRAAEVNGEHRVGIAFTAFEGDGRNVLAGYLADLAGPKPPTE